MCGEAGVPSPTVPRPPPAPGPWLVIPAQCGVTLHWHPPQCLSRYRLISTFCSHIIYCRGCSRWRGLWVRCCRACTSRTALWLGCSWGHPTIIHDAYTMCAAARAARPGQGCGYIILTHIILCTAERGHLAPFSGWRWRCVKK